jgi:hypothetical protein
LKKKKGTQVFDGIVRNVQIRKLTMPAPLAIRAIMFVQEFALAELFRESLYERIKVDFVPLEPLERARLSARRDGDVDVVERKAVDALEATDALERRPGDDLDRNHRNGLRS